MCTWYFIDVHYYFPDSRGYIKSLICVVHFCNNFNSVFHKKVDETYWCSSSTAYQEKRTDWILRIFTFDDKNLFYLPKISTLHFFEDQSDQGATDLVIKPFSISQSSRMESLSQKNAKFSQTPFYFFFYFFRHYIK